jgi:hypothetical protein
MKIGRGNRSTRRKPAPTPLCPPQIPLDQTRDRTRAATVGSQRLTAWAMARPYCQHCMYIYFDIQNTHCNSGLQTVLMSLWWSFLRTETCKGMKNWNKKIFTSHTGRNSFIFYNTVSVTDQNETNQKVYVFAINEFWEHGRKHMWPLLNPYIKTRRE